MALVWWKTGAPNLTTGAFFHETDHHRGIRAIGLLQREHRRARRDGERLQGMQRPPQALHGELSGSDLQDRLRHLHEELPQEVAAGWVLTDDNARAAAMLGVAATQA
jgi:hypothetical protein